MHPWEKSYPAGVRWDARIEVSTLGDLLDAAVARFAVKPALRFRQARLSYTELGCAVAAARDGFLEAGLANGAALALYLPNTPHHPIAFFAALKAGARLVHLSPLDAERELTHKLADSGARVMLTLDLEPLLDMATRLLAAGALDRLIVAEDAAWGPSPAPIRPIPPGDPRIVAFTAVVARGKGTARRPPPISPADIALLQYTGGTTGLPKGAILTHANLTAAVASYNAWSDPQDQMSAGEGRVILVLPLFHIYALSAVFLRAVSRGQELLLHSRFEVEAILADIEIHRATAFPGVPTMWIAIAATPGIEKRDFSSLKLAASGGAPLPVEVADRVQRLTGHRLGGGWGMTETAPAGTNVPIDRVDKPGTIGLPLPGVELDVVALDDPRRVLGPNEKGELRVRGRNVTAGYWNRPEENAAAFVDGWFLTGDIGHRDEDGFFYLVDRKKDMIISGGFNVYPRVIEEAIFEHPDVEEVIVVGVPDAYRGQAAAAFVKQRPGRPPLTLEGLKIFLADKLGRHEMPSRLECREALPRTAVGKLSKKELVEEMRRAAAGE